MQQQQKDKNHPQQQPEKDKAYKHSAFKEISEEDQEVQGIQSENLPDNSPVIKPEESNGDVITKEENWVG